MLYIFLDQDKLVIINLEAVKKWVTTTNIPSTLIHVAHWKIIDKIYY